MVRLGVVSDTHGYWRSELGNQLRGVDTILHAGDVGTREIFEQLQNIAPTYAVRGNVDASLPHDEFPANRVLEFEAVRVLLIHTPEDAQSEADEAPGLYRIIIHGHTHRPRNEQIGQCLWFNPGAAGRARFGRPQDVGFGLIEIDNGTILSARIIALKAKG